MSLLAEFGVAWVIYYEWEGGRLYQFLEDADLLVRDRRDIYEAFCGLSQSDSRPRNQLFKEHLESGRDSSRLESCDKNIRLLSKIGARLPKVPWLKRTPLDWHVAAILWMILGPYVEDRRKESGPSYADTFLKYALASTKHLLAQERTIWTIRDPDRSRRQDVCFSRKDLLVMQKELKKSRKRSN